MNKVFNIDCMKIMKKMDNKAIDLAIVDPPYGIGKTWLKKPTTSKQFCKLSYDNLQIPTEEYFDELFRISKNQIIWGYNYFTDYLKATNYLIIWDKLASPKNSVKYSKAEIAYSSFRVSTHVVYVPWDGGRKGEETGIKIIHPHQKPIALYKYLLKKYAKPKDVIFDSHVGSGSLRIACFDYDIAFLGCEIDKSIYKTQEKRFMQHIKGESKIINFPDQKKYQTNQLKYCEGNI